MPSSLFHLFSVALAATTAAFRGVIAILGDPVAAAPAAVPAFATPAVVNVAGLSTGTLGRQIADVIAADLERSGLYAPLGPGSVRAITMGEVRAPQFADWQARNA